MQTLKHLLPTLPKLRNDIRKLSFQNPVMEVKGKVAIVTGAAKGIGYSISQHLLCYGAKVLMVDTDEEKGLNAVDFLADQYGKRFVEFYQGDINSIQDQEAFFKRCQDSFKKVNIMINNADAWDYINWTKEVEVNLEAVVNNMLLAFQNLTSESGKSGGMIVNMSSTLAIKQFGLSPIFSATKRAAIGLTRCFSDDFFYKKYDIRMCSLCPGITCSSFLDTARQTMPTQKLKEEFDRVMTYEYKQTPEVVAAAVMYLIHKAPHGSIWVIEDGDMYKIDFPHYKLCSIPSTFHFVTNK